MRVVVVFSLAWLVSTQPGLAEQSLAGNYTAYLESQNGTRIKIAQIMVAEDGAYKLDWSKAPFADHFLSMRPFRCLEGPEKHWCHVPYPYEIRRKVSDSDLTDLEYDFLFLWKGATEYGINMWNGIYYKLTLEDGAMVGRLNEMDMDILSAPPEDGELRPVGAYDIEPAEPESFWLPRLIIEK